MKTAFSIKKATGEDSDVTAESDLNKSWHLLKKYDNIYNSLKLCVQTKKNTYTLEGTHLIHKIFLFEQQKSSELPQNSEWDSEIEKS